MKKFNTWFSSRMLMAVAMLMSFAYVAAENVLSINPVEITTSGNVTVPVNLNSTENIHSLVFDITLPAGVSVADVALNDARFVTADEYSVLKNNNPVDHPGADVWRIAALGSYSDNVILAGEGAVMNLTLNVSEDAYLAGGDFTLPLNTAKTPGVEGSDYEISIVAPAAPEAVVSVLPAALYIRPGESVKVSVDLTNNLSVSAMIVDIVLPAGLDIEKNNRGRYVFSYGDRWASTTSISTTEKDYGVRLTISNASTNVIAAAGTGELLSFNVVADDNLVGTSELVLKNINVTMKWNGVNTDLFLDDQVIPVTNQAAIDAENQAAIDADLDMLESLNPETFLADVAEQFGADNINEDYAQELKDAYDALVAEVEAAIDEVAENGGTYQSPITKEKIAELQELADVVFYGADYSKAYNELTDVYNDMYDAYEKYYKMASYTELTDLYNALNEVYGLFGEMEDAWNAWAEGETEGFVNPVTDEVIAEYKDMLANWIKAVEGANQEAIDADLELLEDLNPEAFLAEVAEEYGEDNINESDAENLVNAYEALKAKVEDAIAESKDNNTPYESPITEEDIENMQKLADIVLYGADFNQKKEELIQLTEDLGAADEEYAGYGNQEELDNLMTEIFSDYFEMEDAMEAYLMGDTEAFANPVTDEVIEDLRDRVDAWIDQAKQGFTAITGINAADADAVYYDLNGTRVANPVKGNIYIKVANGNATKAYIK